MAADAQAGSEAVKAPLDRVFDEAYIHRHNLERAEIHDAAYDEGWAARDKVAKDDLATAKAEARLEGFKEGYGSGFKDGHATGKSESL